MGRIAYLERKKNMSLIYFSELRDSIIENRIIVPVPVNRALDRTVKKNLTDF